MFNLTRSILFLWITLCCPVHVVLHILQHPLLCSSLFDFFYPSSSLSLSLWYICPRCVFPLLPWWVLSHTCAHTHTHMRAHMRTHKHTFREQPSGWVVHHSPSHKVFNCTMSMSHCQWLSVCLSVCVCVWTGGLAVTEVAGEDTLWKYKSQRERAFEGKSVYRKFSTETYSSTHTHTHTHKNMLVSKINHEQRTRNRP